MFSLIITVISIALVAALALATIYYGGSAFNKGSDGAKAAQLINEGQQVNAAIAMANAESASLGTSVNTLAGLIAAQGAVGGSVYLAQTPQSFTGTQATAGQVESTTTAAVCKEVQKRAIGVDTAITAEGAQLFGCKTAGNVGTFFYKL